VDFTVLRKSGGFFISCLPTLEFTNNAVCQIAHTQVGRELKVFLHDKAVFFVAFRSTSRSDTLQS